MRSDAAPAPIGTVSAADNARLLAAARRRRQSRIMTVVLTAITFMLAWEIVGRLSHPMFMAPISAVLQEFYNGIMDPRARLWNG